MSVVSLRLLVPSFLPSLPQKKKKTLPAFYKALADAGRERLTQADVVGEGIQEGVALLSAAAAGRARAPRSHGRRGVVHIVGCYCASCPEKGIGIKYSSTCVVLLLSERLMERSASRIRTAA